MRPLPSYNGEPVIIIGNGPVGATAALLLARWGIPVLVLDGRLERDLGGSKAICQQRDVLDVWEAVGVGRQLANEGVTWSTARTHYKDQELFSLPLAAAGQSGVPPFVNLSQSRTEQVLAAQMAATPLIEQRWGHMVTTLSQDTLGVTLTCRTGDGEVEVGAPYVVLAAAAARRGVPRPELRRPVPHLRHPGRTPAVGERASLLLRSAVEPRPAGADPPHARLRVPHRLAGPRRRQPRRGGTLRPARGPDPGDHRAGGRLCARLEIALHLPRPSGGAHAGRAGLAGGRLCPPRRAVRGQGAELRRPRRRERGLEARLCPAGVGPRGLAPDLRRRAAGGGAREPGDHRDDDAVPRAPDRRGTRPPPRRARARPPRSRRAGPGRLGSDVRAVLVRRLPPDHPEPGTAVPRSTDAGAGAPAAARGGRAGHTHHRSRTPRGLTPACHRPRWLPRAGDRRRRRGRRPGVRRGAHRGAGADCHPGHPHARWGPGRPARRGGR